jgi:translation initiation factor IF-2
VLEGTVKRSASVHVIRDSVEVHTAKISSLRRFKDEAREVAAGFECGVGLADFEDLRVGDILEVFENVQVTRTLSGSGDERSQAKKD